ncbi:MAG: flagellar filament capping protein FliD [Planctomycetes bacterium]|nr:flagellar filament capping protein FliD [Planctomycetota bacterium]MCB9909962.1 flagellar filament capping protein FliD [Planctomycetota bacterium]HRV80892.1 flagellar filament capping protein FliD [Planctomycetota bacterium]
MVNTSGISFSGLGSGIDTQSIVNQLVALERLPINQLSADRSATQRKIDKLGQFQTLVTTLKDKAKDLSTLNGFLALAINGANEDVAKISAEDNAIQGTHTMDVLRLASVDRWAFDGVLDSTTDLGTVDGQSISFTVGTTNYDISINADESSLGEIASRINDAAGADVAASVINTGTVSSPSYQLVVASKDSGEEGRIFGLTSTLTGLTLDNSPPDANGVATSSSNITVGNNAQARIDGLLIERSSNDFSDVLTGVNLELTGLGTTNFGVEPDREEMRNQIQGFIDAYNDVVDFMNTQNTFTPADGDNGTPTTGELFGDTALSAVKRELSSSLFNIPSSVVMADTEGFSTLSLVGISQGRDGTLTLDATKFDEKISANLEKLADLFVDLDGFERDPNALENTPAYYQDTTADSGLFSTLVRNLGRLMGNLPNGDSEIQLRGIFDLRKQTLEDSVKRITDRIDVKERALEAYRSDLVLRFARLEELMGGLNAQGSALQSILYTNR